MIVLILIVITTIFFGQDVKKKGHDALRWRVRHVSACIMAYSLAFWVSYNMKGVALLAEASGILVMIGLIIFRYQNVRNLEPLKK